MPDPTDNDPWADLYADLGVTEKPPRAAAAAPARDEARYDAPPDEAEGEDGPEGDDFDAEGQPAGQGDGGDGGEEGEEGAPKKKRRRRRRGKKKPGEETPAGAGAAAGFDDDAGEGDEMPEYGRNAAPPPGREAARPPARPPVDIADDDGFGSGVEDDGGEPQVVETRAGGDASLEGATTEMTRELIANWNVPSWEDLVRGLHRPTH